MIIIFRGPKGKNCVYCQERPSIRQGDHVFSRELFLESERANLIKVPACDECNNDKSKYEHYLTSLLPFGGLHADAKEHLSTLVSPRLERNQKLKRELGAGMRYVTKADENGNESRDLIVPINGEIYTGLFEFIVKALSWFHWGTYLEKNSIVLTTALTKFGDDMFQQHLFSIRSKNIIDETIGKDTVKYFGMQAVDNDQITVWKFEVFNGLVVSNSKDEGAQKSSCIGAISGPPQAVNPFREMFEE
jgi:hypothetical protein